MSSLNRNCVVFFLILLVGCSNKTRDGKVRIAFGVCCLSENRSLNFNKVAALKMHYITLEWHLYFYVRVNLWTHLLRINFLKLF